jgi:hypothetical protein
MEFNINFDDASIEWRKNKYHKGNGYFKYLCQHGQPDEILCNKKPYYNNKYCKQHLILIKKK